MKVFLRPFTGHIALLDSYEPQELWLRYSNAPNHRAKSLSTSGIEPKADARARSAADRPGTSAVGPQAGQMDHVGDAHG